MPAAADVHLRRAAQQMKYQRTLTAITRVLGYASAVVVVAFTLIEAYVVTRPEPANERGLALGHALLLTTTSAVLAALLVMVAILIVLRRVPPSS